MSPEGGGCEHRWHYVGVKKWETVELPPMYKFVCERCGDVKAVDEKISN